MGHSRNNTTDDSDDVVMSDVDSSNHQDTSPANSPTHSSDAEDDELDHIMEVTEQEEKQYEDEDDDEDQDEDSLEDDDEADDEELQHLESEEIGLTDTTTLKQYQWMGFNWLRENYLENRSCILADDMGLGKTIQTLSLLQWIKKNSEKRVQFLVVVPLSTLENWGKEIVKFTHLQYISFHGNKERLQEVKAQMRKNKHDVVITTYEVFRKNYASLSKRKWKAVIFDEGHRLKSYAAGVEGKPADLDKKMKMSTVAEKARQLSCGFKIILSGTPLQNSPLELWSLLNLLNPKTFTLETRNSYVSLSQDNFRTIQHEIEPYILRRTKAIIFSGGKLPPKTEKIIKLDLTLIQKTLYRAVVERNSNFLMRNFKSVPALSILQKNLMRICMHPYLLNRDSSVENYVKEKNPNKTESELLVESSSKLIVVDKLLDQIINKKKEKVLIFCTMLKTLDLLEDYMDSKDIAYRRFDGSTPAQERYKMINDFQNDDSIPVFLLSSKAGGVGINLTAANHVILYNSDYNPTTETQALSRAHRIGQKKEVFIYRLICRQTVEEGILQVASKRQGVHELMLDGGGGGNQKKKLTNEEIEEILKTGLHDRLKSDSFDQSGDKLLETDLDEILENAITVESAVDVRRKYFNNEDEKAENSTSNDSEENKGDNFWTSLFPDYVDVEVLKGRFDATDQFDEQGTQKFFKDLMQVYKDLQDVANKRNKAKASESSTKKDNLDDMVSIQRRSVDMHSVSLRMRNSLHGLILKMQNSLKQKFPKVTTEQTETLKKLSSEFNQRTLRSRKRKRANMYTEHVEKSDAPNSSDAPNKKKQKVSDGSKNAELASSKGKRIIKKKKKKSQKKRSGEESTFRPNTDIKQGVIRFGAKPAKKKSQKKRSTNPSQQKASSKSMSEGRRGNSAVPRGVSHSASAPRPLLYTGGLDEMFSTDFSNALLLLAPFKVESFGSSSGGSAPNRGQSEGNADSRTPPVYRGILPSRVSQQMVPSSRNRRNVPKQ